MPEKMITEKAIEKAVVEYAESLGFLQFKLSSQWNKALPDRLFIYKGVTAFIEFKAPGKMPTEPASENWHENCRSRRRMVLV